MIKVKTPLEGKIEVKRILLNSPEKQTVIGLLDWLETTDFYEAPASTQYHGAEPCGLVNHSLAVYDAVINYCKPLLPIYEKEPFGWEMDGMVAALFHDVCKCGLYKKVEKWRKDKNGKWESYPGYEVNKDLVQIGHGVESLRLIEDVYTFQNEGWAQAVAWHMGTPEGWVDKQQYYHAVEKYPEVLALHTADVYASFIMGY